MTLTWLDIALPIALAAIFAVMRYQAYARSQVPSPQTRAAKDFVVGAVGLAVITLGYKYLTT